MVVRLRSPELVGREQELAALDRVLQSAGAGSGSVVLVGGEAGIGKSRILEELRRRAADHGATVLVGGCVDLGESGLPFAPLLEVMRALRREIAPDAVGAALDALGPELTALVPGLGAPSVHGGTNPARVLEAVVGLVDRLAATVPPLVLAVEDAHWADVSTRDLLALLARAAASSPLVLVVTFRTDELHRRHPLRPLLAQLERLPGALRFDLARFDLGEMAALVAAIRGQPASGLELEEVWRRSGGNPFLAEELLAAGGAGPLPTTVRDALLTRLSVLGDEVQEVLRAAAAVGTTFDDHALAAALGQPPADLEPAVRELVGHAFLEPSAPDRFRFRHALLQEALYDELLPTERVRLHTRVAEHLATQAGRSAELAHHWTEAQRHPEALAAWVRAAGEALAVGAPGDAASHLEHALELWDAVPDADERAGSNRVEVLVRAAAASEGSGRFHRAVALQREAIELSADDDRARRAVMHERLGRYLWTADREAWPAYEEAVRLIPDEPSTERAQVLAGYATMLMLVGDVERGVPAAEAALAAALEVGDRDMESHARNTLGTCLVNLGESERGLGELREALRLAEAGCAPETIARAYVNLSHALLEELVWDEAVEVGTRGIAVARRLGLDRTHGVYIESNLAEALTMIGRWDEALRHEQACADRLPVDAWRYFSVGPLPADRGDTESLERELASVPVIPEGDAVLQGLSRFVLGRMVLAYWQGRYDDTGDVAAAALERMPASFLQNGGELLWVALRSEADRAATASAAGDEARRAAAAANADRFLAATEAAASAHPTPRPRLAAYLPICRAEHRRALGQDTVDDWATAIAALDAARIAYPAAFARLRGAEAAVRVGDRGQAAELAAEAAAVAERLGARPLLGAVRDLQRRARLTRAAAAVGDEDGTLGLSPREREVLQLVADGRTNRQIAEALFISPKTAGVHVSNILAKLGVASRTEAAGVAHRLGLTTAVEPR